MNRKFNPPEVAGPHGAYVHGCEYPLGGRGLEIAGQVGTLPDGATAEGAEAQAEWALRNVLAVLQAADMGPEHLTKLFIFALDRAYVPDWRRARDKVLGDIHVPGTMVIVPGLVDPDWLIEIDARAVKAD